MNLRLFNLVEPVVPIFRALARDYTDGSVRVVLSTLEYRPVKASLPTDVGGSPVDVVHYGRRTILPRRLRRVEMSLQYLFGVMVDIVFGLNRNVINLALSQPPGLHVLVVALARLRRQPTIVHVMDLYPDVAVASARLHPGGLVSKIWGAANRWAMRKADAVVVIGECMAERVARQGIGPVTVIRNWAHDLGEVDSAEVDRARVQLFGHHRPLIVGYSGNIGSAHDLEPLLEAAEQLRDTSEVRFLVRGVGKQKAYIEQEVVRRHLHNVAVEDLVAEDALGVALRVPHVHVVSLRHEFAGIVVPSKAYGAWAAARPVLFIGPPTCDIARDLARTSAGCTVPTTDLLVAAIKELQDVNAWAAQSRAAVELAQVRSEEVAVAQYLSLIRDVAESAASRRRW